MQKICDLHLHSKFSGGASKNIDVYNLANNCKKKGIDILGTGDCLHPSWLSELKGELLEHSPGFFYTPLVQNVYLVLQTEIEAIWKQNNKVNKVHFILLFPNFEKLDEAIQYLSKYGSLKKDGRPKIYSTPEKLTFGLKSIDMDVETNESTIFYFTD